MDVHWVCLWNFFCLSDLPRFLGYTQEQRVREAHSKSLVATILFLIGVSTLFRHSSIRCKLEYAWLGLLHPNHSLLTGSACQLLQQARGTAVTAPLLFWQVLATSSITDNNCSLNTYWMSWAPLSLWRMQLSPLIRHETSLTASNIKE